MLRINKVTILLITNNRWLRSIYNHSEELYTDVEDKVFWSQDRLKNW